MGGIFYATKSQKSQSVTGSSQAAKTLQPTEQSKEQETQPVSKEGEEPTDLVSKSEANIEIGGQSFTPKNIKVKKGTKVVWTNKDSNEHSITIDNPEDVNKSIVLEKMTKDQSDFVTVDAPGTFVYHCGIHQEIQGTIKVVE